MKVMRWCSCALVLCMVMLGSCVRDDEPKGVKEYVKVGDRLPRFSVKLLDGTEVNNATWEGKALVLVFFSTKCPDCQHELPEVERFYRQVSGRADAVRKGMRRYVTIGMNMASQFPVRRRKTGASTISLPLALSPASISSTPRVG